MDSSLYSKTRGSPHASSISLQLQGEGKVHVSRELYGLLVKAYKKQRVTRRERDAIPEAQIEGALDDGLIVMSADSIDLTPVTIEALQQRQKQGLLDL